MAGNVRQGKLPFSNPDVTKAINDREHDLAQFDQVFKSVKAEARDIKQILKRDSTGDYPDDDDTDPLVSAAHTRSLDLVDEYDRLVHLVPTKCTELDGWQDAAERKKQRMDKILSRQGGPGIDVDKVMEMQIPDDKMLVLVQAVATRHGSLDFLRKLSAEHRQLLLSKEEEIAELNRSQNAAEVGVSSGIIVDDEVIPSTNPLVDYGIISRSRVAPTQVDVAQRDLASIAASKDAENKIKDLERQLKEVTRKFEAEQNAHAETENSLQNQLTEEEKGRKDSESAFEQQKDQLATCQGEVVKLTTKVRELNVEAEKLKQGADDQDGLLIQLEDSRSKVEALNERIKKMDEDATSRTQLEEDNANLQRQIGVVLEQNQDLEKKFQGKSDALDACKLARDTAQNLADQLQSEKDSMKTDLDKAVALKDATANEYYKTERQKNKLERDYTSEVGLHKVTRDHLRKQHLASIEVKDAEIIRIQGLKESLEASVVAKDNEVILLRASSKSLEASIMSKDAEITRLKTSTESLQESITEKDTEIIRLKTSTRSLEESITAKDAEIISLENSTRSLEESITEKDAEITRLKASTKSLEDSLAARAQEKENLVNQVKRKDEEAQSQARSIEDLSRKCGDLEILRAELSKAEGEKADTEIDLSLIISKSGLGIAAVCLADWAPLLRSLRDAGPLESVSPDENLPRQAWAILPSWQDSSSQLGDEADLVNNVASGTIGLPSSTEGLLLHLYGCGMAEDPFPCNKCLQVIAPLSALVAGKGPSKVSSVVMVLETLVARLRSLVAISGYEAMVVLSLRYLTALIKARMPDNDDVHVPSLSIIEQGLDELM
ncbi:hypothetical protein Daus18300_013813 [Diaporthe australafricana]|uniref:Uncharacterized protein n=1 Tax=Diaporthe australafricana TaxID=127596 RepID=A0ABR3VXM0_9PEZI